MDPARRIHAGIFLILPHTFTCREYNSGQYTWRLCIPFAENQHTAWQLVSAYTTTVQGLVRRQRCWPYPRVALLTRQRASIRNSVPNHPGYREYHLSRVEKQSRDVAGVKRLVSRTHIHECRSCTVRGWLAAKSLRIANIVRCAQAIYILYPLRPRRWILLVVRK